MNSVSKKGGALLKMTACMNALIIFNLKVAFPIYRYYTFSPFPDGLVSFLHFESFKNSINCFSISNKRNLK